MSLHARLLVPLLAAALAAVSCESSTPQDGPSEADAGNDVETIPFTSREIPAEPFVLVDGSGDSLVFGVERTPEGGLVLTRVRRAGAPADSFAARIDTASREPLSSYQRRFIEGDSVIARVEYGTGFEGQARLTLQTRRGEASQNLRTPNPVLDAAQIPQILAALDFGGGDTINFNYVAPFEKRAIAARLELGAQDTLRGPAGDRPAWPVVLRVGGLVERYWFADDGRLLRMEETTRGFTWIRPGGARSGGSGGP